ncbi:MAG: glycosyltransferase family 39 protein [Planctomycetota bacterium]|nr:glycosyltransferase family 39 protein [Planctomycetota bacterium]
MKQEQARSKIGQPTSLRWLLVANVVALLAVAVFFRAWRLDHMPGVNGDEAWIGVQALRWLDGQSNVWLTPTGNPINVFHFLPQAFLHSLLPPSITLLRLPVLISGLLALVVNYLMCQRAFDRSVAVLSTVLLALLPINIAYSRFAWDASQSVLFTLPVIYASVLAVQRPRQRIRWLLIAGACQLAAIVVHPTNVFVAPLPVLAAVIVFRRPLAVTLSAARTGWRWRLMWLTVAVLPVGVAWLLWPWTQLAARRVISPLHYGVFAANYLDLFSGTTVFRFITGAQNAAGETSTWLYRLAAAGLVLFAAAGLWRQGTERLEQRLLLLGVGLSTLAFFLLAGPMAAAAGNERYAMCLIAPGALLLALGLDWWCRQGAVTGRLVCLAAGWMLLVSFYANYFQFAEATGGQAQRTFRTGRIEPKWATAIYLRAAAEDSHGVVAVTTEWWNYWPLAYLTYRDSAIRVVATAAGDAAFGESPALPHSVPYLDSPPDAMPSLHPLTGQRVCFVEFAGSPRSAAIADRLDEQGIAVRAVQVPDWCQRPVLTVLWPVTD